LTIAQSLNNPPKTNEESTSEELEEDNEELQRDMSEGNHAEKIYIEQWFQETTRLGSFSFSFYFVNLEFQQLDSFILVKFYFSFEKLPLNILLLLLLTWIHWLFDYT
jgi:hypothetical protein